MIFAEIPNRESAFRILELSIKDTKNLCWRHRLFAEQTKSIIAIYQMRLYFQRLPNYSGVFTAFILLGLHLFKIGTKQ
jgi:hypothetical protein